jgi:hypothetical protein
MRASPWLTLSLFTAFVASCSAEPDGPVTSGFDPTRAGTGGLGGGGVADAGLGTPPVIAPPVVPGGTGNTMTTYSDGGPLANPDECVTTKAAAPPASQPKIDIIWVVDTSQSMFDEQKRIAQNMAAFANAITMANIDVSIVMLSQAPSLTGEIGIPLPGICADLPPDPLTGTPLQTDPRYHFVQTYVDSRETLSEAVNSYDRYSMFLRPGSTVHLITVTDDDDAYPGGTPDGRATRFEMDLRTRLGRPFKQHTISSPGPLPCTSTNCELDPSLGIACVFIALNCSAANSGLTYHALAQRTMGLTASICEADWSPIFRNFQENIIKSAPLPCDYKIPPPPTGESLNKDKVNVAFTPAGGSEETFPRAESAAACGSNAAWHYDNPAAPSKVVMCPNACTKAQAGGSISIGFGCATFVLN